VSASVTGLSSYHEMVPSGGRLATSAAPLPRPSAVKTAGAQRQYDGLAETEELVPALDDIWCVGLKGSRTERWPLIWPSWRNAAGMGRPALAKTACP